MKFKKILKISLLILIFLSSIINIANADVSNVTLTIRDGSTIVFSGSVPLEPAGTIELNGHPLDADSVLSVLNDADVSSDNFQVNNLQYYDSFGSFYLKCITSSVGNDCDNWQYVVDNTYGTAIDKTILQGGENVYLYFGSHYKITLDSNSITTDQSVKVTAQNYDYQNNNWIAGTGLTVGIIQPNSWPVVEIQTSPVDGNGEAVFSSIPAGSYNVGIQPDYFPTETLNVTSPLPVIVSSGGGGGWYIPIPIQKPIFDVKKAFDFITSKQKENGSFGENLYTDWTALALASGNNQDQIIKLVKYFAELKTTDTLLTDYERHAMALMALGLNPYDTNSENYIKKITDSFDGKQFGDINENNDDIFALIILQNAGFAQTDEIINNDVNFVLSKQRMDGSWDSSVDITGAGIEALSAFSPTLGVGESLKKAETFLKQNQKDDGGWGNVSSTAWAIEGILALNEKPEDWIKGNNTPLNYLAINQDTDGSIKDTNIENKIWETAYTLTALSGKTWNQIMQRFNKPEIPVAVEIKKGPVPKVLTFKRSDLKNLERSDLKKEAPGIENLVNQKATVINAITPPQSTVNTEIPRKNWFVRFLDRIFSIF